MESIFARCTASISELKRNPTSIIEQAEDAAIAILNHNKTTAYLIPAKTYETLINLLEDYQLGRMVKERQNERNKAKEISLEDL